MGGGGGCFDGRVLSLGKRFYILVCSVLMRGPGQACVTAFEQNCVTSTQERASNPRSLEASIMLS